MMNSLSADPGYLHMVYREDFANVELNFLNIKAHFLTIANFQIFSHLLLSTKTSLIHTCVLCANNMSFAVKNL